jgi:hypothetical protein
VGDLVRAETLYLNTVFSILGVKWSVYVFTSYDLILQSPLVFSIVSFGIDIERNESSDLLEFVLSGFIPLSSSCLMDVIATGMIAGRLIFFYRRQKKIGTSHSNKYLPVIIIFIESSALSTMGKISQIMANTFSLSFNPYAIPVCVCCLKFVALLIN